jgi:hypothetical protein
MAELLIRVADKTSPDADKNELLTKAGDVICVCPDGWPWSAAERSNPEWRIVRLPGIAPSTFTDLLEPEMGANNAMTRKRARGLNVKAAAFKALALSSSPVTLSAGARTAFLAARKTKPARGNNPVVIG